MSGWRLLLTRPDEECAALAASLGEAGVHSSSLPLLAIDPLEETPEQRTLMLDLDRYCAVVVVSKPAARLGLERLDRYWPQPPQQTWCSVGAATAAILEAYGLDVTYPEQGDDSEALLALPAFQDSLRVHDPKVLIMRGEGGREFLAERLRGQGVQVDYLPLYRRRAPDYPARRAAGKGAGGTPERPGGQQWTGFAKSVSVGGSRLARDRPVAAVRTQPAGRQDGARTGCATGD